MSTKTTLLEQIHCTVSKPADATSHVHTQPVDARLSRPAIQMTGHRRRTGGALTQMHATLPRKPPTARCRICMRCRRHARGAGRGPYVFSVLLRGRRIFGGGRQVRDGFASSSHSNTAQSGSLRCVLRAPDSWMWLWPNAKTTNRSTSIFPTSGLYW